MQPVFFATPAEFREWLERNHTDAPELLVGFYRKGSELPSITWPESVDEALRFGWIDGVRRRIDEASYSIRFTPRKATSVWSTVNIRRMEDLIATGQVAQAGLAAFESRSENRSRTYSYEQEEGAELDPEMDRLFRASDEGWAFFCRQPPGYRKSAIWWVVSAKRDATRQRRLATLIEDSAQGRRLAQFRPS